jgi:hypothetical protein
LTIKRAQLVSVGGNVMMNGRRLGFRVAVLVLVVGEAACMTMRPVEPAGHGAAPAEIEAGDRISILDTRGNTTELTVTTVGVDFIEGTAEGDLPVRIAAAEIEEIRARRVGVGKTVGLGVGVALALFVEALSNASFFP